MQSPATDGPHARCEATTRAGIPCRNWAMQGQRRCRMHGGSSPQAKRRAAERLAARQVEADLSAVLAHEGLAAVGDPFEELGRLASESIAFKDALAGRVNALREQVRYRADGAGTEQLRAEVALYERAMDRTGRFLDALVRNGFEERRTTLAEHQGRLIAGAIQRILSRLALSAEQQALVPTVVPQELRAISAEANA